MSRLLFLFCFAVLSTASPVAIPAPHAKRAAQQSVEDEGRTAFPQSAHHTEAFNVVHVIAAVVGIVGAAAVAVIAFIMCRRRRRQQQQQQQQRNSAIISTAMEQASVPRPISSSSANSSATPAATPQSSSQYQQHQLQPVKSISTFDQFASAYCHDERQGADSTLRHNNNDTPFIPLPSPPPPPYRP
ncbi:hypothetical protein BDB00DRAFT_874119 [Zychaea mexicana]|uniref:uncharacterized protein n=1 Tax=Zychaea mexicana TaxID=64656 RepID=UPI0022FE9F27|nr:uncharacterized protein BDB00DRAFT_874119 [Zychaea mexicana]KAI9491552.1 hypothetical protein BDB00DRAFT_874119 [Zychaea mexicana]